MSYGFLLCDKFKLKASPNVFRPELLVLSKLYNISLDVSSVLRLKLTVRFLFYHTIDKIVNFQ